MNLDSYHPLLVTQNMGKKVMNSIITKEDAEEFTQGIGQVLAGSYRHIELAYRMNVPEILGYEDRREYVKQRLGGFVKLDIPERREAVLELKANGLSNYDVSDVLGIDEKTVRNDLKPPAEKSAPPVENFNTFSEEEQASAEKSAPTSVGKKTELAPSQLIQQSLSNDHYTPPVYLASAREVMGGIDLDPASCAEANEAVQAKKFYTIEDDGLSKEWVGRVWLNPPYGRLAGDFVQKFIDAYSRGKIKSGIILVNAHCTDTNWFQPVWDGVLCFTDHRINFYGDEERSGSTHGSVFSYFGPDKAKFAKLFQKYGPIVARYIP